MRILILLSIISFSNALFSQGFSEIGKKKYNNVYAAIIGISEYNEVQDLEFADNDAQLFYDILNISYPEFKDNFSLVQNEAANDRAIKQAIFSAQKNAGEGDLVIIYFSGHGDVMLEPGAEEGFFLAHDASDSREYFVGGAIEFDWINKMTNLATSKKAEVWLVTDACHAGKVINQESVKATMTTLNSNFANTTKFISCQAHELSYEYSSIQHGAFTYFLAKCLSGEGNTDDNGTLNIDEISSYLKKEVRLFTDNKQSPKLSTSDEFAPFINISEDVTSLIKEIDKNANSDVASRGKGEEEGVKSNELLQFEKALYEGKLYGSSSSAKELLELNESKVSDREQFIMRDLLIDALLNRSQRNTNLFLSGRSMIGQYESMESTAEDLKVAAELLGEDHFMYEEVLDKSAFFIAMDVVQNDIVEKYSQTEKTLLALQAKQPKAAYLHQGLGMLYLKMTKNDAADAQLDEAQKKISTWSKPRNTSAYMHIANGNLDKALAIIEETEKTTEDKGNVAVLKTQLFSAGLELQSAEKEFSKISINDETVSEAEYYAMQAKISQLRGQITVAENYYLKALKEDDENVKLLLNLGDLYKNDGDTAVALKYYRRAQALNTSNATSANNIALLSGTASNTKVKINFFNTNEVLSSVDLALSKGKREEAIDILKASLKISKFDPELDYALGKAYYSTGNNKDAILALESALEKSPYHFESIKSLVNIHILKKDFTKAQELITKYNEKFRYSAKWKVFNYEAYKKMQKTGNAIFALEEAIKLDPNDTEAYKSLYRLNMQEGNYRGAEVEYDRLHKLGGRKKDSLEFLTFLKSEVEGRIDRGKPDNKAVEGLKLILKYDKYFLARLLSNARDKYQELNYRVADIYLEQYKKYLFAMQGEMKYEYYRIKAYLLLEVGMYQESLDLFRQVTTYSKRECYIGVAMAKYELGHGEEGWMNYFRKSNDTRDLNSVAIERYRKMNRNKGYHTPGGR